MDFKELVSPSLKDLFVKEITENILSGKLVIGERLPNERELSQRMKVSRAVVNSGFIELQRCGLIKILPRRGAFVADYKRRGSIATIKAILEYNGGRFDPVMLESIYEARIHTERHIMRLAARNRTEKDIDDIKKQFALMAGEESPRRLGMLTHEFYHLLFVATGNLFYPLNADLYGIICVPIFETLSRRKLKARLLEHLQNLVGFIEQRDEERAIECAVSSAKWELKEMSRLYRPGERF